MLEVKNLKKSFGNKKVLKGISFNVSKGDVIGIIGPSGCGKSTLLRCLNLLEIPTSGTIIFEDKKMNYYHNLPATRQKIGMVFQSFNLFNNMTVLENIILAPTKLDLLTKEEATKKANELLKKINLLDKKDFYPDELSGGEKQRIAIVRALLMEPELMLFDEPTSALDPEMIEDVLILMKRVATEGMTMIVVTHELDFAKDIATKVLFVDKGEILEEGTPNEIFNHPKTERLKEFLSKIK